VDTLTIAAPPIAEFLVDWRDDHRPLDEAARSAAGSYIEAIVRIDRVMHLLGPAAVASRAAELWIAFRESYDGLRGPFVKSDAEDVRRALGQL
jgi:hypothetical protein